MNEASKPLDTSQETQTTTEEFGSENRWLTFYQKHENAFLALAALLLFLIIWELLPSLGLVKPIFTSSPTRILKAAQWLSEHGLWNDIRVSATEFFIGFFMAVLVGIPLGILLGWYQRLNAMLDPFITALNATPRVALLPLIILWLGIGTQSIVAVVFLGAVFPILLNVMAGVKTIDEELLRCARSFGACDRQIFTTLAMPTSVPFIIAGMRLAVGRGLVGVVVGELLASNAGIGFMMNRAGATFQTDKVFVGLVIIALSGYLLTEMLRRLESHYEYWRPGRQ